MRRALPVLAATAGGLALLANFQTKPGTATVATGSAANPTTSTVPDSSSRPSVAPPGVASTAALATATTAPATPDRAIDGPVVPTAYGDVQVRVTLNGTRIVDVQALELPNDRSRSVRISNAAAPLLREEVLQAQNANINLVSGASYTSYGYAQSLQAALDQANR